MTTKELNDLIDQVVNPQGGDPKVEGPALNNLLKCIAAELEAGNGSSASLAALSAALDAQKTRLDQLVDNAPPALDTLKKLADQLAADEQGTAAILATQQQHTQQLANDVVHKTGDEAIDGSKHFKQQVAVDGNVTATAFVGDGSQLTGLPAGADVNKAYVDAADTALGTRLDAQSAAIATQLGAKAVRIVKATRERVFYTGIGTVANPSLDGLKQAIAAAVAGDTVEQITNAALQGVGYNGEQVRIPSGVNFISNGFALDSRGTAADGMTLLGGKGIVFGHNSTVYHSAPYSWGLGMYNTSVDTDYVLYDLHITSAYTGSGRKAFSSVIYNVGNVVHYGNIDSIAESAACVIGSIGFPYQPGQVCNYTHYGRLTINQQTIGLRAENVGRILHVGDLLVKDTASTAGLALNNGQIEMRSGVLDLSAASAQGGFMLSAQGKLTLTDVRVVGGHLPAIPTTSSQGAGATLVIRGTTSGFDKTLIDPLITVIDERETAGTSYSENDDALFAFQVGTSYNPSHFHLATLTVKELRQLIYDADTQYPGYSTVRITTDEAAGHRHTVVVTYDPQKHALQVVRVENEDGAEQQNHSAYPIVGDANYAKLEGGNTFVGSQSINGGTTYGTYQSDRVVLQGENSIDMYLTPSSLAFNAGINVAAGSLQATGPGILTVSTTHFKVPAPTESADAATKAYVDAHSGSGGGSGHYLPAAVDPSDPGGQYLVTSAVSFSQGELIVGPPANDYDAVNAQWVGERFLGIDVDTHAVATPLKLTNGSGATLTLDVTADDRLTVNGQVLGSGFTPSTIQSALVNSGNTNWSAGEYVGPLPAGSAPGMKFRATNKLNQAYVFEYLLASNDVNGTQFSWSRYGSS